MPFKGTLSVTIWRAIVKNNVTKCMIFTEMYARHVNVLMCRIFFRINPVPA